ncbi:PadR family transcriptional regulator [Clostridium sp. FP2]|uniref:PadR family transcriptional regulator n=1 Tax=Clostridium sp. FP2 TaxID=2724481 RepID=UPI00398C8FAE
MVSNNENIALTEAVYYILLSLYEPLHGYGVMQKVEGISSGRVKLAAGTLYGAISTLLEKGWICALPGEANSRKKEYEINDIGKNAINNEISRLRELLSNGEQIVGGAL